MGLGLAVILLIGCDLLTPRRPFATIDRLEKALADSHLGGGVRHLTLIGPSDGETFAELWRDGRVALRRPLFPAVLEPELQELALAGAFVLPLLSARFTLSTHATGAGAAGLLATDDRGRTLELTWSSGDPLPSSLSILSPLGNGEGAATLLARRGSRGERILAIAGNRQSLTLRVLSDGSDSGR